MSKDWQGKSFQGEMHLKEMIWQFRFCFCWHRQIFTATFSLSLVCADWRWSPYSFLSFLNKKKKKWWPLSTSTQLLRSQFCSNSIFFSSVSNLQTKLSSFLAAIYHWVTFFISYTSKPETINKFVLLISISYDLNQSLEKLEGGHLMWLWLMLSFG